MRWYDIGLVKCSTGIEREEELLDFMQQYRPTMEFTASTSDYEFQYFIKIAYQEYKKEKAAQPAFRQANGRYV